MHQLVPFNSFEASLANAEAGSSCPTAHLVLVVDGLSTHVGAALQQLRQNSSVWEQLGFFSKKLDKAQMVYCALDRELLAVFTGIRQFCYFVELYRHTAIEHITTVAYHSQATL